MEPASKKIAKFLQASTELERYLHEDGALAPLELQTIRTTIGGVQTMLESWMRRHRPSEMPSVLDQMTRKAEGS